MGATPKKPTIELPRMIRGTYSEAESGVLELRVRRLARQDHLVAIANLVYAGHVYVLLTSAPSIN